MRHHGFSCSSLYTVTPEQAQWNLLIEDLLTDVDTWCHFTQAFHRPNERAPRMTNFFTTLLATLIAHGTNLGLATMANSVEEGITADRLQAMSQWCLREDTLQAANAILVRFH